MNVLYLINFAGKAGTEKYVENLVRILGQDKIKPFFAYNIAGELSEKMEKLGVPSLQLDMGKKNIAKAAKILGEYCLKNSIDVVHCQYPRENIVALKAKKFCPNLKVLLTNHLTLTLSGLKGFVWRKINRKYTPKNHKIIAVCREGANIMLDNGVAPDKIKVVFNGIEPKGERVFNSEIRKELGLSDECFIITIFARFAPEKGLSFLIDVLNELKKKAKRDFCCLVCGDGDLFSQIQGKIKSSGLENNCKLLGYRSDTEKILQNSNCYVCTSSHNEAMSFAILEAMNSGLPLVVTNVGGNRDLAENRLACGYVVEFPEVEEFSSYLLELMEDEELEKTLSANAIEKIKKYFDLEVLAQEVFECYK